jgi:ribosomal protein L11 methyltransferase
MQNTPRNTSEIWSFFLTVEVARIPEYLFALETLNATASWSETEGAPCTQLEVLMSPETGFTSKEEAERTLKQCFDGFNLQCVIQSIKKLPHKNWLEENRKQFPPIPCGPFFIYCDYYTGKLPHDKISIKLNAALAFGSGEHETTRGCLLALEKLYGYYAPKTILDLGCGSGILAIAASKLWPEAQILATDFDHFAVQTTQVNAKTNNSFNLTSVFSDGFKAITQKSFELIIANILANPLISFAPDITKHMKPNALLILSGFLERQTPEVQAAYEKQGFTLEQAFHINTWSTLILKKDAA